MKYIIRYNYDTGDSFHTETLEENLGEWMNLEIAEKNLQRIREHYEYYCLTKGNYCSFGETSIFKEIEIGLSCYLTKEERKKIEDIAKQTPWYVKKYNFCLNLLADNGENYQISAPWCGFFERLNSIEIITENKIRFS
jgi:hypothetical protein